MIYPSLIKESLKETVDLYNRIGWENSLFIKGPDIPTNITVDEYAEKYMKWNGIKDDRALKKTIKILKDNEEMFDFCSREIINKLLGDTKLMNKFMAVTDGSHLSNRIWLYEMDKTLQISVEVSEKVIGKDEYGKFWHLSEKDKINYLFNHFDQIFVQFPIWFETSTDFLKWLANRIIYSYDDYDIDYNNDCWE